MQGGEACCLPAAGNFHEQPSQRQKMKKNSKVLLVGASCAALCSVAAAQSSVTLSGFLDIAVISTDHGGGTQLGGLGASDFVFSGTEDLGAGLKATFKLASRFNLDSGGLASRAMFHEESTVGLQGDFGSVRFGRALTPMWNNDWNYDAWYNFDRVASPAWKLWHGNSPTSPSSPVGGASGSVGLADEYARLNNGVFYGSPTFGGFRIELAAEVEKNTADPDVKNRNVSGAVMYGNGAFSAMLSAERNSRDNKVYFAAAKYAFGDLTVMGGYDDERAAAGSAYFTGKSRNRSAVIEGAYAMGLTTLKLGYGRQIDGRANFIGAGATYALSKRTNLVASLGHSGKNLWGAAQTSTSYALGMNHSF